MPNIIQGVPWTVNNLELVAKLVLDYRVDGIITDGEFSSPVLSCTRKASVLLLTILYLNPIAPQDIRRWAMIEASLPVAPRFSKTKVLQCLAEHNQLDSHSHLVRSAAIHSVPTRFQAKPLGLLVQH